MTESYFSLVAAQLGISVGLLAGIIIWSAIWKAIALWKSARNNHLVWFIVFILLNYVYR